MCSLLLERRGELEVGGDAIGRDGRMADAYLSVRGWTMGLAFVNGFNLGWYWPERGPANTMCALLAVILGCFPMLFLSCSQFLATSVLTYVVIQLPTGHTACFSAFSLHCRSMLLCTLVSEPMICKRRLLRHVVAQVCAGPNPPGGQE